MVTDSLLRSRVVVSRFNRRCGSAVGLRTLTWYSEAVVAPLNFVYLPAAAAFCASSFSFAIVAAVRSVRRPDFWRRLRLVTE